jgi:hypothetical protein
MPDPRTCGRHFAPGVRRRDALVAPRELGFRPIGGACRLEVGSAIEAIPAAGRMRRAPDFSFVARVVEVVENERVSAVYDAGAFRGTGVWTLERVSNGTRLRMRWQVQTHGLAPKLLGLVVDLGALHSRAMKEGFRRLDELLATTPEPTEHALAA